MPPPLWPPPIAIMLNYLYAIVEKFPFGNPEASQCAPPMGAGLAQGGAIITRKEVSTEQILPFFLLKQE